jgi:inner membrane protein
MEPVTHFMTGAVLSRAGFNRKAAYATLAMTLAAETPDLDVFWSFKGPVAGFEHHRA